MEFAQLAVLGVDFYFWISRLCLFFFLGSINPVHYVCVIVAVVQNVMDGDLICVSVFLTVGVASALC